jgi:hypothetical protein
VKEVSLLALLSKAKSLKKVEIRVEKVKSRGGIYFFNLNCLVAS